MASTDLQGYFNTIRTASGGEAVRDAIINAAKSIRTSANNAATLGGVDSSQFALRSEYDKLVTDLYSKINFDTIDAWEDDDYVKESQNVMTSGNLYEILHQYLRPALASVMHYEIDPETDKETKKAIQDYLNNLKKAKDDMYKALKAKTKVTLTNNSFRDFVEVINHIDDSVPNLESGSFSKNGTYYADKVAQTTAYTAFDSIKVNISDSELKVNGSSSENNTTKYPPEGKLFGSFNVNIPNASTARSSSSSSRLSGTEGVDENGLLESKEITENGTYIAADESLNGYKSVSVNVTEPVVSGELTVTFMNGPDVIGEPVVVPAYGTATYTGETPINNDDPTQEFYGWFPVPVRVTSDMTCEALFRAPTSTINNDEISDDWETICNNTGRNYSIGEYKSLNIGTVSDKNYGNLIMQKVADWGNGAIWCSKTVISGSLINGPITAWPASNVRKFLNNDFLDILASTYDGQVIVDSLIEHRLITMCPYTNWEHASITETRGHYDTFCEMETVDKIWIPSIYELAGFNSGYVQDNLVNGVTRNVYNNVIYGIEQNGYSYDILAGYTVKLEVDNPQSQYRNGPVLRFDAGTVFPDEGSPLKKTSSTNTSSVVDYMTRSIRNYGNPNASSEMLFNYHIVTSEGTAFSAALNRSVGTPAFPICFSV